MPRLVTVVGSAFTLPVSRLPALRTAVCLVLPPFTVGYAFLRYFAMPRSRLDTPFRIACGAVLPGSRLPWLLPFLVYCSALPPAVHVVCLPRLLLFAGCHVTGSATPFCLHGSVITATAVVAVTRSSLRWLGCPRCHGLLRFATLRLRRYRLCRTLHWFRYAHVLTYRLPFCGCCGSAVRSFCLPLPHRSRLPHWLCAVVTVALLRLLRFTFGFTTFRIHWFTGCTRFPWLHVRGLRTRSGLVRLFYAHGYLLLPTVPRLLLRLYPFTHTWFISLPFAFWLVTWRLRTVTHTATTYGCGSRLRYITVRGYRAVLTRHLLRFTRVTVCARLPVTVYAALRAAPHTFSFGGLFWLRAHTRLRLRVCGCTHTPFTPQSSFCLWFWLLYHTVTTFGCRSVCALHAVYARFVATRVVTARICLFARTTHTRLPPAAVHRYGSALDCHCLLAVRLVYGLGFTLRSSACLCLRYRYACRHRHRTCTLPCGYTTCRFHTLHWLRHILPLDYCYTAYTVTVAVALHGSRLVWFTPRFGYTGSLRGCYRTFVTHTVAFTGLLHLHTAHALH